MRTPSQNDEVPDFRLPSRGGTRYREEKYLSRGERIYLFLAKVPQHVLFSKKALSYNTSFARSSYSKFVRSSSRPQMGNGLHETPPLNCC